MERFDEFLQGIENTENRAKLKEILEWIQQEFPQLESMIKWNQPIFADHGTFIIGFSVAAKHMAVAPEVAGMKRFSELIEKAGYSQTNNLFRIGWQEQVDFDLLRDIITFNIVDKAEATKFWR